jgi:arylformamidase
LKSFQNVYDISVLLGVESITYPGDPPYQRELVCAIKKGEICDVSRLEMSAHAGTHIDSPSHFIADSGKTIDRYPAQEFIMPAWVLNIENKKAVHREDIETIDIQPGDALLFKTENSRSGRCKSGIFSKEYVYLTPEAAEFCVGKRVRLVGIDYISIEKQGDDLFPTHKIILGNNIFILEGINLAEVVPGKYTLLCLPLKISGGEASPVRAILVQ